MDFFQKHRIDPDLVSQILQRLNFYDAVTYCYSSKHNRDQICRESFWKNYLSNRYPGIIRVNPNLKISPTKTGTQFNYLNYTSNQIVDLFRRQSPRIKNLFPQFPSNLFQRMVDYYTNLFLDYVQDGINDFEDWMRVDLQHQTKIEALPQKVYLRLKWSGENYRGPLKAKYSIRIFLKVVAHHLGVGRGIPLTGIIIGEISWLKSKPMVQIIYSSQMTDQYLNQPYDSELDHFEDDPNYPYRELIPSIDPTDPIEKIASILFHKDPSGGIYLPLDFNPKQYHGEGQV